MQQERAAHFAAWVESFEGEPQARSLAEALGVRPEAVRDSAKLLLSELDPAAPLASAATEFATAYRAYVGFQELLELVLEDAPLAHRHYCYYESLIYLREIGHCLLGGNLLAVLTLQRPFIELATLHLYWRSRDDGYVNYYRWFASGVGKPPFKNYIQDLFRWLPTAQTAGASRVELLRDSILGLYSESCSYVHAAELQDSFVSISGGNQRITREGTAIALTQASICLRQILFLYVLAYPMVLFPRPLDRKFGFGGPVGLFASHEVSSLVEAAIGRSNAASLRTVLTSHPEVTSRLDWFDSFPDLSDDEIEHRWQAHIALLPVSDAPPDRYARVAMARSQFRAFGWVASYLNVRQPSDGAGAQSAAEAPVPIMVW